MDEYVRLLEAVATAADAYVAADYAVDNYLLDLEQEGGDKEDAIFDPLMEGRAEALSELQSAVFELGEYREKHPAATGG